MDSRLGIIDTFLYNFIIKIGESVTLKMNQIRHADAVVFTSLNST